MDLRHFKLSPAVSEVPDFVSSQDRERLIVAKQGAQSSQRTAQVLEEIMSRHPPSPYLEVEYAMAMNELHAPVVALAHFRKAQELLPTPDEGLDELIKQFNQRFEDTSRRQHVQSLHAQYYQTWVPSKQVKFPLVLPRLPTGHELLKEQWSSLTSQLSGPSAESFSEQYVRMLAIETNQVENAFLLSDEATDDLVKRGVAESRIDCQPESEEKDIEKIKSIVNDTLAAYDFLFDLAKDTTALTKETICDVHAHLMRTCRFSPHTYIPPGLTRSETRKTVIIQGQYTVQCCPFAEVDDELAYICKMAVQWIRTWRNPFGTASWLHLVLGRCHPFDEGNGRVSRIIASIPLVMNGYPPISVNLNTRSEYYAALDKAYSGDHGPLIECFVNGMQDTMASIQVAVA